jgi:rhodanese-related sulfurtransferase
MNYNVKRKLVLIVFALLIYNSCSQNPTSDPATPIHKNVDANEAYQLIQENKDNEDFAIIDVRTPSEYDEGHIKNAININYYADDFRTQIDEFDTSKIYLIYCKMGGRSASALEIMAELGFQEVYNLSSGIIGWKAEGYQTVGGN